MIKYITSITFIKLSTLPQFSVYRQGLNLKCHSTKLFLKIWHLRIREVSLDISLPSLLSTSTFFFKLSHYWMWWLVWWICKFKETAAIILYSSPPPIRLLPSRATTVTKDMFQMNWDSKMLINWPPQESTLPLKDYSFHYRMGSLIREGLLYRKYLQFLCLHSLLGFFVVLS